MSVDPRVPESNPTIPPGDHTPGKESLDRAVLELQRRERELQKREQALKSGPDMAALRERAKTDRDGLLKELGLDGIAVAATEEVDPVSSLQARLEAFEKAQREREEKERADREFEQFKSKFQEKAADYEFSSLLGKDKDLFDYVYSQRGEDGSYPDWEESAKQLEETIIGQLKTLSQAKKFAGLFAQAGVKHPLDSKATLTSGDRPVSQSPYTTSHETTGESRQEQIDRLTSELNQRFRGN